METHIHPSILSADFMNFEREFETISAADAIHVDVMDGHFVPNLTFGLPVVKQMRAITTKPLDIHLMIDNPDDQAINYAEVGCDSVTFHLEAATNPELLAKRIRAAGAKVGIAVKPATGLEFLLENLNSFDMLLVMTVEPGFGGQRFMDDMLEKVETLSKEISSRKLAIRLQVDGGVDLKTVSLAAEAGADTFVAGNSVFQSENRNDTIEKLRSLALSVRG